MFQREVALMYAGKKNVLLSFIMKLDTLFFFSTCVILCSSAPSFDRQKVFDELDDELMEVEPAKHVAFLKKKVVNALEKISVKDIELQEKISVKDIELGKALSEKDTANSNAKKYIIPLTIRDYAVTIEEEYPDIMKDETFSVPKDVWMKTPVYNRYMVKRAYKWYKLLEVGKNNDYIKLIINEVNRNFMIENNVEEIDENMVKYKDFRLAFCKSIVKAIEYGNKIIAHSKNGTGVKYDIVVFSNVVDKYMTMFYNAMVEMPVPKSEVESTSKK